MRNMRWSVRNMVCDNFVTWLCIIRMTLILLLAHSLS